jgi:glutathione S-transferase
MIELVQIPYSPFCIVQRRILQYSGHNFKIINIPNPDRSLIWKLTKERYYAVPIIRDEKTVVFETDPNSQVIAKYIDQKYALDLFPPEWEGLQTLIWNNIENEVEDLGFRLNDVYYKENVPAGDRLGFVRHKERKFGRGCLEQWAEQQKELVARIEEKLLPYEQMLATRPFLLDRKPRFVDFDLFGIIGNYLYTGHYELPASYNRLQEWYAIMSKIKFANREKLRT